MAGKHELEADQPAAKRIKVDDDVALREKSEAHQEQIVGITAFVSPSTPGFRCIVKQRYTDFLVNEITPDGKVAYLEELPETKRRSDDQIQAKRPAEEDAPAANEGAESEWQTNRSKEKGTATSNGQTSTSNGPSQVVVPDLSDEDQATLHDIFGEETTAKIQDLYASVLRHPQKKPRDHATVRSPIIAEKQKRTQTHVAVRRIFDSKLQTETLQDEAGVIAIKAAPPKGNNAKSRGQQSNGDGSFAKGKMGWDDLGGEYLHFTLYKENKDTMEVLYFIASQLKIPVKNFQFAGTKDRRGVTVQRVAVYRVHANRIANLNGQAKGWVASGFAYKRHGLELGELTGNEFTLTLRDCHFDGEEGLDHQGRLVLARKIVSAATNSFKTKGFLNYYGLQRFGTYSSGTHITGMKMLQNDLEGATNCILSYSSTCLPENVSQDGSSRVPQDDITRADAIRNWRQSGAVGYLPRRFSAEQTIMQYLSKKEKKTGRLIQAQDWQGALMTLQRNLRMMYVHAYQSLVWNTAVGKRWALFGDKIIEGDLVVVGEKDGDVAPIEEEVDEDGEVIVRPAEDDQAHSSENAHTRARPLSKEEAESGKYDIFDIVLPLPGFDVVYPHNAIGKFYEEFMGSEAGGRLDPHNMRRSWKEASLSGGYRKIMARPLNGANAEVKEYADENEQLVETDLEKLKKATDAASEVGARVFRNGRDDETRDKRIAVVLQFQLGSSQYATMAIRELTKGSGTAYKPDYSTTR
ncbi:putative pseudouridine synthase TruD/Pus7 [Teratosphaeria nubilosa]|uniref:Putative pseudouridine synthase TruD/Pus7 n=1 Tax=Teratosphaeria nubilosa TaxID=161662 RepID=A0A6G1L4Y6_9PEZI|nr:putative pseudouridine synthase TruD/Pus7 [Teratosphaeria nubilosa]